MEPTLHAGDVVLCARVSATSRLRRRAIVILERRFPDGSSARHVKRLIAQGGECPPDSPAPLAADHCWVLGDNPAESGDSRTAGPLPRRDIVAVAFARVRGDDWSDLAEPTA